MTLMLIGSLALNAAIAFRYEKARRYARDLRTQIDLIQNQGDYARK